MKRAVSVKSLTGELDAAKQSIRRLRRQRRCWRMISIALWYLVLIGLFFLGLTRLSYLIELELITRRIIIAQVENEWINVSGYDLTIHVTSEKDRTKIENKTISG